MANAEHVLKGIKMTDERAYEEIIAELEAAVATLENEPLGLEQSLALYEKGHKLLQAAQNRLSGLEGRMERLLDDGSRQDMNDAR